MTRAGEEIGSCEMAQIREEREGDESGIRAVNLAAFRQAVEADIVDKLCTGCDKMLSLVAVMETQIVGHILFSPVTIESGTGVVEGMGLGPMAVLPEHQRRGIGSELVREGLGLLRQRACPFVVVLGHPEYYPRFGFERASRRGIRCQWEGVPDEAFMIFVMDEAGMKGVSGVARYQAEFEEAV